MDLEDIRAFIGQDDREAASDWLAKLIRRVETASRAPFAGRSVPEIRRDDVREVLQRSYRIVYLVRDASIDVLTVFHGSRLIPPDVTERGA